ncbi:MAG: HNH endonuclease signature motif containing protein [Mycolicibacterium sp.]|uniref:HNH endonuclease signature motif containing protein n=1 Tax=Mycolicibacterium sp. TaxID=2320850 RepID=UPI003D12B25D
MGEVSSAVDAIIAGVESLQAAAVDELSHREIVAELARITTVAWRLPAVEHRLVARLVAETEPSRLGESSWKKVLTTALRISGRDAGRRLREAASLGPGRAMSGEALAPVWEATAAAQAQGVIGPEHVEVIAKFHHHLPGWVDVDTRQAADAQLAGLAAGLGPEHLHRCADRLLAMIDQDGPAPSENDHARARCLSLGPQQRDGMSKITGWLTPAARAVWEAVLAKLAAPGQCHPEDAGSDGGAGGPESGPAGVDDQPPPGQSGSDLRTQSQRNHDALVAVGQSVLASGELGQHHGLPVTVIVSTTLQELESGAGVAVTGGGSLLPMREVIAMAANAYHYLAVFDQHTNQALYLGRAKRCASVAQRMMLYARDRGCTRPGCTAPGNQSQVHHVTNWKHGGRTDIDELTLACGPDNRLIEKTGWSTRRRHDGRIEWIPPPDLDTGQHRTNTYHHPEQHLLPDQNPDEPDDQQRPGEDRP